MDYIEVSIRDEFIRLGQALKLSGAISNGSDAKYEIQNGSVEVNGEVEVRRGRKLYTGDVFVYDGQGYKIV